MNAKHEDLTKLTYPLRAASRLTGLSPELLRAWERRYGLVTPERTPGGTRRYSDAEIERLRLAREAVDLGHRISKVAKMADEELRLLGSSEPARPDDFFAEIFSAMKNLDGSRCQQLLGLQFSVLGPSLFLRQICAPLLQEIGERWTRDEIGIAEEHLASSALRSLLGSATMPTAHSMQGPLVVLATPSGERHELGLLMATLTVLSAGASPLYLGVDLPVEDIIGVVEETSPAARALSLINISSPQAIRIVNALRGGIGEGVPIWIGGGAGAGLQLPSGVEFIRTYDEFEQKVGLLPFADKKRVPR